MNKLCECGCGQEVRLSNHKFIHGHNSYIMADETKEKIRKSHIGMPGPNKGKTASLETKRKMSETRTGRTYIGKPIHSDEMKNIWRENWKNNNPMKNPEYVKKNSLAKIGKPRSAETKRKLRISQINRVAIQYNNGEPTHPNIGQIERIVLSELETIFNITIKRQKLIDDLGYWVDGYITELNIIIEFDEEFHYRNNIINNRDLIRQKEIENKMNSKIFRIREIDWLHNKDKVISDFRYIMETANHDKSNMSINC